MTPSIPWSEPFLPHPPESPTEEFMQRVVDRLDRRISAAELLDSPAAWIDLFAEWNELDKYLCGERHRINMRHYADVNDPAAAEAEKHIRERIAPLQISAAHIFVTALLASRHREAVVERFGSYLLPLYENSVLPLDPVNTDLRTETGKLTRRYGSMIASAETTFRGETMTLRHASGMMESDDRTLRRDAFMAVRGWFTSHRDELTGIFDELVKLRHRMALNLGHENFIPLGYLLMRRIDYGPDDVAEFRRGIREHAVPMANGLRRRQAEVLGLDALRPWDLNYDPSLTIPRGIVPVEHQLDMAGRLFERLSPRFAEHFNFMRREGLIDLENRKGKRSGAFCSYPGDENRPAIHCNSIGDVDDVRVLIHEMGHALQYLESSHIETLDLRSPSADVAEVHSIGLEFLTLPYVDEFFAPEIAERFRRARWKRSITAMCYRAMVDEFQHEIYLNPDAGPDERDAVWKRIAAVYEPGIDYSGVEEYEAPRWYGQAHIFRTPFYYIDYAIAETAAMQLAMIASTDHERAMGIYLDLCRAGGRAGLAEIYRNAGLRSPFDPGLMRDLMEYAAGELEGG